MLLPAMIWLGSQILGWDMVDMETVMLVRGALEAHNLRMQLRVLTHCGCAGTRIASSRFCAQRYKTQSFWTFMKTLPEFIGMAVRMPAIVTV